MTTDSLNVLAIGNAIVDVLARVHDDFLDTHGMVKASMALVDGGQAETIRSEEHTSELQSLMRISYAVFCLKKKKIIHTMRPTANRSTQRTTARHDVVRI